MPERTMTLALLKSRCKVEPRSECWEWMNCLEKRGYGRLRVNGKSHYAHRVAYILAHGKVPEGLDVMHNCDNRRCCNPEHLFAGTRKENVRRTAASGRMSCGLRHSFIARRTAQARAKLTMEKAREIRRRMGEDKRALAAEYGVSEACIRKIWAHEIWKESGWLIAA